MTDSFYSSIAAIQERKRVQQDPISTVSNATDLSTWVIDHLDIQAGSSVLDTGGSNGPQAIPLARLVGYNGYVLSIDRSYETLHALAQRSQELGLETRIRLLQIHLDDLEGYVREHDFDRALASRALTRLKQPRAVVHAIHRALKPGGLFFFYGPSRSNNLEIKRFHASLRGEVFPMEGHELTFLEEVGLPLAREYFAEVELVKFDQPLLFDSPEALYTCWSSSKLYTEELDVACRRAVLRHFEEHPVFETVKRVVGIKATR